MAILEKKEKTDYQRTTSLFISIQSQDVHSVQYNVS